MFNTAKSIKSTIDSTVAAKDKVFAHVKEHKEAYIAGAASSATTAIIMLPLVAKSQINITVNQTGMLIGYKSPVSATAVVGRVTEAL